MSGYTILKTSLLVVTALAPLALGAPASHGVPPGLKPGQTLTFCGASITHQRGYTDYVSLFYATRYPEAPVRVFNAGVGGNSAAGALPRFRADILEQKPAVVALAFGTNDGRYQPFDADIFATYQRHMTTLMDRVRDEAHARVVLLTPPMYDRRKKAGDKSSAPDYNLTLVRYGQWLTAVAKERGLTVIDLNAPMVAITAAMRTKDPAATLSRDGVHPAPTGHLVIAHAILTNFGVEPVVSSVTIDAAGGEAQGQRCELRNVNATRRQVRFDLTARSLPYPYAPEVRPVLAHLPFTKDLNRETLRVTGLADGVYVLTIDGAEVGRYPAGALAEGINLADNAATPQHRQAEAVRALHDRLGLEVLRERRFRLLEKSKGYRNSDGTYPRKLMKTVRGPDGKVRRIVDEPAEERFAAAAAEYPRIVERIAALRRQVYAMARPVAHRYRLRPEGTPAPQAQAGNEGPSYAARQALRRRCTELAADGGPSRAQRAATAADVRQFGVEAQRTQPGALAVVQAWLREHHFPPPAPRIESIPGGLRIPGMVFQDAGVQGLYDGGVMAPVPPRQAAGVYVKGNSRERSDHMRATFELDEAPGQGAATLELEGLDCDHPVRAAEIRVEINGRKVWQGPVEFAKDRWSRQTLSVRPGVLRQGANTIVISNVSAPDSITSWYERWALIAQVVLRLPAAR